MITIFSYLLVLIGIAGFVYSIARMMKITRFKLNGDREAKAAFAKLKREQPDSPKVALSEAEFVHDYMKGASHMRPFLLSLLFLFIFFVGLTGVFFGEYF